MHHLLQTDYPAADVYPFAALHSGWRVFRQCKAALWATPQPNQLSQRSGWADENGSVYVIYPIRQMADDLNRSERTVKNALNELENAGLLLRVRQGWNRANRLFLQVPDEVQVSSRPAGKTCPIEVQDFSSCMVQDLPPNKNNKKEKDRSENKERESPAALVNFRMCFFLRVSWHLCNLIFQIAMWNISTVCRSIWPPTGDTTPITTPPCGNG